MSRVYKERDHEIAVTGLGHALVPSAEANESVDESGCDPVPYLRVRKSRKFMGVQDDLAVVAAGRALADAGLGGQALGESAGLFLAVGYLPFDEADVGDLAQLSSEAGRFSMKRFVEAAYPNFNPLTTFRCLSNMPAYHVSVNFDLQGPYFVGYPGPGQFYLALETAIGALLEARAEIALVGGVAYQRNFLVEHHFGRIEPPVASEKLLDAAGFLVLETRRALARRGAVERLYLAELDLSYRRHDPFAGSLETEETFFPEDSIRLRPNHLGAASLPTLLSRVSGALISQRHTLRSRDGISASSAWMAP